MHRSEFSFSQVPSAPGQMNTCLFICSALYIRTIDSMYKNNKENLSQMSKVIKNTTFLYLRMIIVTIVSLFSVRIILEGLGLENFGVYNLIANVVLMATFLNGAISLSLQRNFSYYIVKSSGVVNVIYNTGLLQLSVLSIILIFILEIAAIYLFNGYLVIPESLLGEAKIAFQISILTMVLNIFGNVNVALITAKEDLHFEAMIKVFDSLALLACAYVILYFFQGDIILYSSLVLIVTCAVQLSRFFYVKYKYQEIQCFKFKLNSDIFKKLLYFNVWNSIGSLSGILRSSGIVIIINVFFGPIVNAAYAISAQINSKLKEFSLNMLQAVSPHILKTDASGERLKMLNLSKSASKFGVILLGFPTLPLLFEMDYVLNLWLKDVPQNTVIFCQLILVFSLINMMTVGLQTAIQAIGNIAFYQITVGGVTLLTLPLAFIFLKNGYPSYFVIISMIIIEIIAGIARVLVINKETKISISDYFYSACLRPIFVFIPSTVLLYLLTDIFAGSFLRLLISSLLSSVFMLLSLFYIACDFEERKFIIKALKRLKQKFK
ncbi:lipopolysaccharide biosynthesis protein [Vibrio splendidus]